MSYKDRTYDRFWSRVKKLDNDCWIWIGGCFNHGHGCFGYTSPTGYKDYQAHRFSWILHNLPEIGKKCVLHLCQRPNCVNPEHLYLGDHSDNALDYWNNPKSRAVAHVIQTTK